FGEFDALPTGQVRRIGKIRDRRVVPTRRAVGLAGFRSDEPVARTVLGIGTKTPHGLLLSKHSPKLASRLERRDDAQVGQISQTMLTAFADGILEVDDVLARLALKQSHCRSAKQPVR